MIGKYLIEWTHVASGEKGIRPSKADPHEPDTFKKRSDALDYAAHLNVRAFAYRYKAIPSLGKKIVGPYISKTPKPGTPLTNFAKGSSPP